jgi:hypothetical protein
MSALFVQQLKLSHNSEELSMSCFLKMFAVTEDHFIKLPFVPFSENRQDFFFTFFCASNRNS